MDALLLGDRRDRRQQLALLAGQGRAIADDEYAFISSRVEVWLDQNTTGAIGVNAEPMRGRRGLDARSPNHAARFDALAAERDAALVARGHRRAQAHFDAKLLKSAAGMFGEILRKSA